MLTGIRWEPTADRLSGRTVDQVAVDSFQATLRGATRSPEFGPAARPRSAAEAARIRGSDASREAVRVQPEGSRPRRADLIGHRRHGHLRGIAEHRQHHPHRGAHVLIYTSNERVIQIHLNVEHAILVVNIYT